MRQVPEYLLIGNGRVAKHFQYYLSLLHIPYRTWYRAQPLEHLAALASSATHILLLISDRAIVQFIQAHLSTSKAWLIHFSGNLVTDLAYGAHPLMCFSEQLYSQQQYQAIPFIIDDSAPEMIELLPGLPNKEVRLDTALKAKYHALCVLSGNFSCLLWQKLFDDFERELNIPSEIAHPYLMQQMQNLLNNQRSALTGPLVRNDQQTINANLQALKHDPYEKIYASFVECYQQSKLEEVS